MQLIKELEKYRLRKGLSQEKLAEKLDVSFVTINRWLNHKNKPSLIHFHRIKNFLKNAC